MKDSAPQNDKKPVKWTAVFIGAVIASLLTGIIGLLLYHQERRKEDRIIAEVMVRHLLLELGSNSYAVKSKLEAYQWMTSGPPKDRRSIHSQLRMISGRPYEKKAPMLWGEDFEGLKYLGAEGEKARQWVGETYVQLAKTEAQETELIIQIGNERDDERQQESLRMLLEIHRDLEKSVGNALDLLEKIPVKMVRTKISRPTSGSIGNQQMSR